MEKEPKFTVCTELTEADFVRFNRFELWHKKNTKWSIVCFVAATCCFYLKDIFFNQMKDHEENQNIYALISVMFQVEVNVKKIQFVA